MVPFESLGTVSYSPSIVTVAVCLAISKIFSAIEWRDLENQVRGRSRSFKMAPFDRSYATFYWSAGPKKRAWRHGRAWKMKIRALKNHDPCFEFASKLTQLYRHKV